MKKRAADIAAVLKPHSLPLLAAAAAGLVRYAVPLAVPWGVKVIIDDLLAGPKRGDEIGRLGMILSLLFAAYLIWMAATYARLYFTGLASNNIIFDLRHRLFLHVQKMSSAFFDRMKTGGLVSRMVHDISILQQMVTHGATSMLMDLGSVMAVSVILFSLHWKFALLSLSIFPVYAAASQTFGRHIRKTSREVQQCTENLSANLHEKTAAMPLIQSFGMEKKEEVIFLRLSHDHRDRSLRNVRLQAAALACTGFLTGFAPVLVIGYGAVCVLSGELTLGELMAFYGYVGLLYQPAARLSELNVVIANSLAAFERISELLRLDEHIHERPHAVSVSRVRGKIAFRDVDFAYASGTEVLRRASFQIESGECVALIGQSGAGKTTIARLLLRLYDVQKGAILMDDLDLRDFTLSSLRRQIGWVSQDPVLFSGTVLENILYGRPGARPEEAFEAARLAHAHDFILALPDQYETEVGEKGARLSAGERQRIAIARTYLKDAPILLLDEPTSALDEFSAFMVNESLREFRKGRTVILFVHNPPSASEGIDKIIRLTESKFQEIFPNRFAWAPAKN